VIDKPRRRILGAVGIGTVASVLGTTFLSGSKNAGAQSVKTIRWGIVGTGGIANSMARMIKLADASEIGAVSSRRMESAREFADEHSVANAYDSWQQMIASDDVDAIYVATPTSVREEICIAAANGGKHVLGEKPFASLPSVKHITAACRDNGVAFMDGTHFVHHPRTLNIKKGREDRLGFLWSAAGTTCAPRLNTWRLMRNSTLSVHTCEGTSKPGLRSVAAVFSSSPTAQHPRGIVASTPVALSWISA